MIDWYRVPNFTPDEFPENPDQYADPELIYTLQTFRFNINQPIYPSPVKGALARFNASGSQHKATPPRKSKAVDIFITGTPIVNLFSLMSIPKIKGVGVYLDTAGPDGRHWVMTHMDIRTHGFTANTPLIWICKKDSKGINRYYYPQKNFESWSLLQTDIMYRMKHFGR